MAGIHFDITGDNSNFLRRLHEVENGVKNTSKQIEQNGLSIEDLFNRMTKATAAFGAGFTAKELISNIAQVRSEFQQLEVAFKTMLGSEDKANSLMRQLVKTAATTPFDLQGVANGAKQLLAYGENVENVNDDLIRLGNIAAGLSQPLNDLVYLYGTTMTQGRLYTQDYNQFVGRGIPMGRELAKIFGIAENEVRSFVEEGKVGFPEVQKVIMSLTNEGGMFYNLMQEQSKTITGQISNIEDAFATMLNEIGKANEGIINDALFGISYLVENYEVVGRTLLEIVGTYGAYRTALISITALQKVYSAVLAQSALNQKLAAASGVTLSNAQALATTRTKLLQTAQAALNKTMLDNLYVIVAAAVAALGLGIYKLATYQTEAEKAQKRLNDAVSESESLAISEQRTLAKLKGELSSLTVGTDKYNEVKEKIVKQFGKYYEGLDEEITKVGLTEEAYNKLTEAINKSFGARQYEKFASQQQEELSNVMSENLKKIQEQLYDKLGDETGSRIYSKIREGIVNGSIDVRNAGLFNLSGLDKEVFEFLDKVAGKEGGWFDVTDRAVEGYIVNIINAVKLTEELDKKARERFGIKNDNSISKEKSTEGKRIETTYQQDLAKAKEDWEVAKKGYEALLKDQLATSKQVKDAKDKMVTAEEKYKDLGGITGSSLTKQENQAKKVVEEQRKQQEQLSEQLLSLRRKNQQDEINLMEEGSEKKLAQIDLDYQKELDAIEKQRDEWNKSQKGKLTDEQETQLFTSEENAFKIYEKNVKEVNEAKLEADRKAWQEYFIEFGNYQEKRKNLIQKYDDEIAKLQMDSPEYASKTAEKGQALEQLDEQFGKSTKVMADLFEDASSKSVSAIQSIIDKYETLVKYMSGTKKSDGTDVTLDELKSVGFTDSDIERLENGEIKIKDVIDAIKGLKNELKEKSPWQSFRTELGKGIDTIKNANGDTQKLGQGITDIGNAVTSFIPALSEFGSNIANIFGVDDSKITGIIDAVGGLGQTAVGVGQIMSGDIFGGAMSAVSGISSIVSALDGLFGADYSHYNAMKERYDTLNEIWDELISKKKEYIDISYGTEALKAGQEALDIIKKSQDAQRNLARTLAQSGASAGSHSIAYRQNAALGGYASELYRYVHQNGNYNDITNALLGASAEQLQKVKEQMPELWAGLDGDFREHLNNIISGAEQAKEVLEQMKEAVAGISFDEFRSGYIDLLSDLDSTNEDFADNFEKYLQKSIFESLLANKYKERIQALYDTWVEYGKDGLTPDEVQKLRDMQEQLSESLLAERDKIMSDFGFTTNGSESKSSTSKGFSTMSQDTGEELSGRFTALQIAGEEIKNQMISAVIGINSLVSISSNNKEILDSILNQHVKTNNYLEDITKYAKLLNNIKNDISEVKSNTKSLSSR